MQSALESIEGVESAEIDFKAKTATITTNGEVAEEDMIAALESAGFGGSVQE